ncbi:hypothetical protein AAMO2058_000026700 [Amorphochlora amoebiformis]
MTTRKRPIDENRTRKGPIKKRGRGRPKKKPTSNLKLADEVVRISADGIGGDKSSKLNGSVGSAGKKRGRGRPKKKALPSTTEASVVSRGKALTQTVSKSSAVQDASSLQTSPYGSPKMDFKAILRSVVKIYCTYTEPHFALPWQMKRQDSATSSGFIIGERRIMGNAHGIAFHSVVRARRHGESRKFIARVLHVGHECDLALLTVDDDEFWKGLKPLSLGGIPQLQDKVNVVGYPTGGDNICVTQGIVSRIGVGKYSHTEEALLAVQIDAAINAGNSGGPAVKGNIVVGVAFETLDDAENIGYIIPTPVIRHFLNDIEKNGEYKGFANLGIHFQTIENKGMKKAFKLLNVTGNKKGSKLSTAKAQGVLIRKVEPLSGSAKVLRRNDVLVSFDNHPIASDGTVKFRDSERVAFNYLITSKYVGEKAEVGFIRNGVLKKAPVSLGRGIQLVRTHMYDQKTSYFIYGGLVFTPLSFPYLEAEYGKKWDKKAPIKLCDYAFFGIPKEPKEQIVILNQVLISDVNVGYETFSNLRVFEVNGTRISNMGQLVKVVSKCKEDFVTVLLEEDHTIVIDAHEARKAHEQILEQNNIEHHISEDLRSFLKK